MAFHIATAWEDGDVVKMVGGSSFIQTSMDPEEKMMKLDHVLEKLKSLDPKTFGMLNNMISSAEGGHSFLQVQKPDMEEQMMKLQPVLEKLRSLDPKTFGLLNNMMDQAQATSFLQTQDPMDQEDRLAKLGPILDKLKTLDPKTAAMLSKMVGGDSFLQTSSA